MRSVGSKLRQAGIKLQTRKPMPAVICKAQWHRTLKIVKLYTGLVFTDRVERLEGEEVKPRYKRDFRLGSPHGIQSPNTSRRDCLHTSPT